MDLILLPVAMTKLDSKMRSLENPGWAGLTRYPMSPRTPGRDHPRLGGACPSVMMNIAVCPSGCCCPFPWGFLGRDHPRAVRGLSSNAGLGSFRDRTIPGWAGLPDSMAGRSSMGPDHPRPRGASSASVMRITVAAGPFSPARGFRPGVYMRLHRLGIIPIRTGLPPTNLL